jgi:glycosyltransferase involved in cell wall biosynthesis
MLQLIEEQLKHKNYYNGQFCENPEPVPGQAEPKVIFYKEYHHKEIKYSVVIPIFNQEEIIERNLLSVISHMEGNFEIIIILDACIDNTETIVLNLLKNINVSYLVKAVVIKQETPVFETTCDNMGFLISTGKYIVEIQADMEMTEYGFNTKLAKGLEKYSDIIAISGRCTHILGDCAGVGKLGTLIDQPLPQDLDKNLIYMYGTCNRGPLVLDREKLKSMKFLDEQNYFLDGSEHDLFTRAYFLNGWRCGYIPIEFNAPTQNGSTRKNTIPANIREQNEIIKNFKNKRGIGGFEKTIQNKTAIPIEIRPL